jgi:hypothetical protein
VNYLILNRFQPSAQATLPGVESFWVEFRLSADGRHPPIARLDRVRVHELHGYGVGDESLALSVCPRTIVKYASSPFTG